MTNVYSTKERVYDELCILLGAPQGDLLAAVNKCMDDRFKLGCENCNLKEKIEELEEKLDAATCCAVQVIRGENKELIQCSTEILTAWTEVHAHKLKLVSALGIGTFGPRNPRGITWEEIIEKVRKLEEYHNTFPIHVANIGYLKELETKCNALEAEKTRIIAGYDATNNALHAELKEARQHPYDLQRRYDETVKQLLTHQEKIRRLEAQIKRYEDDRAHGAAWEKELRKELGIGGPHEQGVKIIDAVKKLQSARSVFIDEEAAFLHELREVLGLEHGEPNSRRNILAAVRLATLNLWSTSIEEIKRKERERILALLKKHLWSYNMPIYPPTGVMGCSPGYQTLKVINNSFWTEVEK